MNNLNPTVFLMLAFNVVYTPVDKELFNRFRSDDQNNKTLFRNEVPWKTRLKLEM